MRRHLAAIAAINGLAGQLKAEIDTFRVEARSAPTIDHRDVHKITTAVLDFWRKRGTKMPTWRKAAKRVFAIPPTSAASERVFSATRGNVWPRSGSVAFGPDPSISHATLQPALQRQREVGEWLSEVSVCG